MSLSLVQNLEKQITWMLNDAPALFSSSYLIVNVRAMEIIELGLPVAKPDK